MTSPAPTATRLPTYTPQLDPAELRAAAAILRSTGETVSNRALSAREAAAAIAATGFAGPVPDLALARLGAFSTELDTQAQTLRRIAELLIWAARAQAALDAAARAAQAAGHYRIIVWLNALSMQLDTELAREINRARGAGFDALVNHPDTSVHELHEHHMSTLPASTQAAIDAAGGTVLEAGPSGTTVLVGDPIDPARVITMVAGATTGHPDSLGHELQKAQLIAQRTGATVVVWQGYQPPKTLPRALSPASASEGAAHLAMFQAALEERYPDAQKTVVAHSYGTVVATRAAQHTGLLADELWLLGSPGVYGESVDDLTLAGPSSQVFVVDADRDPILSLRQGNQGVLGGSSPSNASYGATVVEGVRGDHSSYFTDDAFLTALSQPPGPKLQKSVGSAVER